MTTRNGCTDGSAFRSWFKAQFGKVPNSDRIVRLEDKIEQLEYALLCAKSDLNSACYLQAKWDAALYAWNARTKR